MTAARHDERAMAMAFVIAAMFVVAALGAAVAVSTMTGRDSSSASASRSMSQRAIDDGVELYRLALETGAADESTGWVPPPSRLQNVIADRGTVVPLSALPGLRTDYRATVPGAPTYAVRMAADEHGRHRFWQLVRVTGPGSGDPSSVTAWFRGWYGRADGSTGRQVVVGRASLTPGGFHQFQLLVDGVVRFDDGAMITGPVHSNGTRAGGEAAIAPLPGARVGCSGEFARLSASDGSVSAAFPDSCRRVQSTRRWSFGAVGETFDRIAVAAAAGGTGVMVAQPADTGRVPVRLLGDRVDVGGQVRSIGQGLTILVLGEASVAGTSRGRVTVASDPSGDRAGQILVDGDVVAEGAGAAIGLYTDGDVVVSTAPCVGRLDAAVIAARGGLTIDRSYRTELAQLDSPSCGSFAFHGSIAAAQSPVLRWTWPNGAAAGFSQRSYAWNPRLVRTPPPWTPVIEGWQVRDWQEAASSCGAGGRWDTAVCR